MPDQKVDLTLDRTTTHKFPPQELLREQSVREAGRGVGLEHDHLPPRGRL